MAVDDKVAPTFDGTATVTVGGGSGVSLKASTGATDNGDGTISLNSDDWVIGTRSIVFMDSVSVENLTISIEADDDSTLVGQADSVVVVNPNDYTQLLVSAADDSVMQGENFMVNVVIADKFGNQRVADNRFVAISTSTIGVQVPPDAVHITKGAGSFMVNSSGWSGDLTLSVRDIADREDGTANTLGTGTVYVRASDDAPVVDPDPEEAPDAPDQLVAEDYAGASGEGDQGGFVLLTWDASDDHDSLDKYRVYRQIAVSTVMDEETGQLRYPGGADHRAGSLGHDRCDPGCRCHAGCRGHPRFGCNCFRSGSRAGRSQLQAGFRSRSERGKPVRADGTDHVPGAGKQRSRFRMRRFSLP